MEGVRLSPRARQILTRSPHQPQGGPPTQGLRSHHQPPNRLGTVAHQLKPKRRPSAEIRHPPSRRRTGGSPPHRQCRGHGLPQWQLPPGRATIRRTAYHPAPGGHSRPRHHRRGADPHRPAAPDPTQRARIPGPAPQRDQRPARVKRTVLCRGGTQIIGQRVQV